jgi:hypothetical protein
MRALSLLLLFSTLVACRAIPGGPSAPVVAPIHDVRARPIETAPEPRETGDPEETLEEDDESMLTPCTEGPTRRAAADAARQLDQKISALADAADPKALTEELHALLETPCFKLSAGDPIDGLVFSSALSLKSWWSDGGESWAGHYLELGDQRRIVVPPTPRGALVLDKKTAKLPLAPLLCPASAASDSSAGACGRETLGWARRADRALAMRAQVAQASWNKKSEESCADEAKKEEPSERYSTYRTCVDDLAVRRSALPLGRFKAPTDGWLVLESGRGGCGELRAYDLASGAAVVIDGCAAGSSRRGGAMTTKTGRVSIASLREAAWMLFMWPTAERRVRTETSTFEVPKDIVIERKDGMGFGSLGSIGCGTSSSMRRWSWMRGGASGALTGQISGILRPSSCDDVEDHAAELMSIADDSFEEGCSPKGPPAAIAWTKPGPAASGGEGAQFDDPQGDPLRDALVKAKAKTAACTKSS